LIPATCNPPSADVNLEERGKIFCAVSSAPMGEKIEISIISLMPGPLKNEKQQ